MRYSLKFVLLLVMFAAAGLGHAQARSTDTSQKQEPAPPRDPLPPRDPGPLPEPVPAPAKTPEPAPQPAQNPSSQEDRPPAHDPLATDPTAKDAPEREPSKKKSKKKHEPGPPSETDKPPNYDASDAASIVPSRLLRNIVIDQRDIWTAPFHARIHDLNWIVPAVGLTARLVNADAELSSRLSTTGTVYKRSSTIANGGLAALVGIGGGLDLLGRAPAQGHTKGTGVLAGEAAWNAALVDEVMKFGVRRERPTDGTPLGLFGQSADAHCPFTSN